VAAAGLGRRYVGYDTDPTYVDIARSRVGQAPAAVGPAPDTGQTALHLAEETLVAAGFTITRHDHRVPKSGVAVSLVATDAWGSTWFFDVAGPYTSRRGGLLRTETVWRHLGRAHALRGRTAKTVPLVLLTTQLPRSGEGDTALRAAGPAALFDIVDLLSDDARARLTRYATGGAADDPQIGFWTVADLDRRTL
jgi:site-specific DNA-methyltransferase (adenine-specific)